MTENDRVEDRIQAGQRLRGKVAIVTGAGRGDGLLGTGAATAMLFAAQGAQVGVLDIDEARGARTRSDIERRGDTASVVVADVTDPAGCARAVERVVAEYGRLDVLVNNAASTPSGADAAFDPVEWHRILDLNLLGVMQMSAAAIPAMGAVGGGAIVNVSSIAASRAFSVSAYSASKAGVLALSRDLAFSYGREGIRVNSVVPGHLYTPMGDTGDETWRELRRRAGMLGTEGDAWDVAWAALFLACDESRWITAAELPVDAGTTATTALAMHPFLDESPGWPTAGEPQTGNG